MIGHNLSTILQTICARLDAMDNHGTKSRDYEPPNKSYATVGNSVIVNAKLPKGGWLKNPFEELKFFGKNDAQNPKKFLRKFENISRYEEVEEREQLYYF